MQMTGQDTCEIIQNNVIYKIIRTQIGTSLTKNDILLSHTLYQLRSTKYEIGAGCNNMGRGK